MSVQIVILEGKETNPGDLSWDPIRALGEVMVYEGTKPSDILTRARSAEVIVTNKLRITAKELAGLPKLRLISQLATGTDNIDLEAAKAKGIEIKNTVGYGTRAVAQHTWALILELTNHVGVHDIHIHEGGWTQKNNWTYSLNTPLELADKTLGIVGFGQIGQAVHRIAKAFGMKVLVCSRHGSAEHYPDVQFAPVEVLFEQSDFITLHTPLTLENQGFVDAELISRMKPEAYLINTARGALINELDLRKALLSRQIAGAALDVLAQEPPTDNHPLVGLANCILTPHIAWTAIEARKRIIEITAENIRMYLEQR